MPPIWVEISLPAWIAASGESHGFPSIFFLILQFEEPEPILQQAVARCGYDLVAEVTTEVAGSTEVRPCARVFRQVPVPWRRRRTEQGELADVVPLAELFDFVLRHGEGCAGHMFPVLHR